MSEEAQNTVKAITWLPIIISIAALALSAISLIWNFIIERTKKKAKLQVWQRGTFYDGCDDNRTKINLVLRNLSHRPTAILDVYVRNKDGGVIKNYQESKEITLPIKVEPWDIQIVSFRVSKHEEQKLANIMLRDIDDNEIVVISAAGKKWQSS